MNFKELDRRKDLMAEYGGNYIEYNNNNEKKEPLIITIINNYEVFTETYGRKAEIINTLFRDSARYGIIFIVSELLPNTIRPRVAQNFNYKLCLQLPNDGDYRGKVDAPKGLIPAKYFGRGICFLSNGAFEFQTAYFVPKNDINSYVRSASKVYNEAYEYKAPKIPSVPKKVLLKNIIDKAIELSNIPIGYRIDTKELYYYDFTYNAITPIVTNGMNNVRMSFIFSLIKMFTKTKNTVVKVIDFVEAYDCEIENVTCIKDNFDQNLINLNNEIFTNQDESNNYVYVFLGIGGYKRDLSPKGQELITNIFTNINKKKNIKILLVDVLTSFKQIKIETWYNANVDSSTGIWLAEDAASQMIINCPNITIEERKYKFPYEAFSIVKSNHVIIKHVIDEEE